MISFDLTVEEEKDLSRIQSYMETHEKELMEGSVSKFNAFIFPDGKIVMGRNHDKVAQIVGDALDVDEYHETSRWIEDYGVIRAGYMADTFYFRTRQMPTKKAESVVIDKIIEMNPSSIQVSLSLKLWREADYLAKRIEKETGITAYSVESR